MPKSMNTTILVNVTASNPSFGMVPGSDKPKIGCWFQRHRPAGVLYAVFVLIRYTLWNLEWMIKVIVDQRDRIIKRLAYII